MPELLDVKRTQQLLRDFDFKKLFIEELGWNHYDEPLTIQIKEGDFLLKGIAEKADLSVFIFDAEEFAGDFPSSSVRSKIEIKVTKLHHEHLIIWIDRPNERQIWQWVKREKDQPIRRREHPYYAHQEGLDLIQRLNNLAFTIDDEERGISILDSAGRTKDAFDVEKVTKKFYERFQQEHSVFLKFLNGIPDEEMERWYVSVMLNRLMFIYFIQKKGFLDKNPNYLRDKLELFTNAEKGSYYKEFLCPLFFEGFAKNKNDRTDTINELLGTIPYLNGGLFLKHQIEEQYGKEIEIDDDAFRKIFDFFEDYSWHLDVRKSAKGDEINPDVLGHIFEKYINQKQMGAYYTKEDITGYISKNTILPFLFDRAEEKCKIAFEGEKSVWNLLKQDPDRYIYDAVKKGTELSLPEEIESGINEVSKRTEWNKTALEEYALPTEIWREVVARRERYEEVKAKIRNGEIRSINDFITYNLDIRQFAQDVIETCEGPELLRAFWHAIVGRIPEKSNEKFEHGITVLDPTCGSGAFLFAALNILEPLYEACIDRMQIFIDEADYAATDGTGKKYSDFRKVLESINKHPNRDYFIFKSIILNNLYGVDIMEEAVEICKLRLFLKLVAQINDVDQIEPLPDIDFNIRAGNTLVGYTSLEEVEVAGEGKIDFGNKKEEIKRKAEEVERLFKLFRQQQTELGGEVNSDDKAELISRLGELEDELNRYLADQYAIDHEKSDEYKLWLKSHKPFHWFIEFYGIMEKGGFDVIIGNPPYVQYRKVHDIYKIIGFKTQKCNDLFAYVMERSLKILEKRCGLIIPISYLATDGFLDLRILVGKICGSSWNSSYSMRPSKLFEGAEKHLCIWIGAKNEYRSSKTVLFSTKYHRWLSEERDWLMRLISYVQVKDNDLYMNSIPKVGTSVEKNILRRLISEGKTIGNNVIKNKVFKLYHTRKLRYFVQFLDKPPLIIDQNGNQRVTSELKTLSFADEEERNVALSIYCSTLFFWYYLLFSDCRNVNKREVYDFPLRLDSLGLGVRIKLSNLSLRLMENLEENSAMNSINYKKYGTLNVQTYSPRISKPIINEIDQVLAEHYAFTDEELDFIINYDIKYRMGKNIS